MGSGTKVAPPISATDVKAERVGQRRCAQHTIAGLDAENRQALPRIGKQRLETMGNCFRCCRCSGRVARVSAMYLLFERLEAGRIRLDTLLKVSEHASEQAPSKLGLQAGQMITAEDAIKGMITKSANDAAVVVAENLGGDEGNFANLMTQKARALGIMTRIKLRSLAPAAIGTPVSNVEDLTLALFSHGKKTRIKRALFECLDGQNQTAALLARLLQFLCETFRPLRHAGITASQTSQRRLVDGSTPAAPD